MSSESRIRITPLGGSELEPYIEELRALKPKASAAGIKLEEFRTRAIDPTTSTIVLTILGVVVESFVKECLEALLRRKEEPHKRDVQIVIELDGKSYHLPEDATALNESLRKSKE